jgi:Spy/CpxP family protein refolding chaperone
MKKLIVIAVSFLLSAGMFAQSNKEDVDLIQSIFGKEKKEVVQVYMTLPEAQTAKFWALYDTYETARKKLGQERIKLIEAYANNYEKLDSKKATELITKKFAWADKYTKFQQLYFTKFSAIIGGLQAAKFFQLEDYIENCIRVSIQEEIPFIGELDKTKTPGQ